MQLIHQFYEFLSLLHIRVWLITSKWYPPDVVLWVLALVDATLYLILKAGVFSFIFVLQEIKVVDVIPQEVFGMDVFIEIIVGLFKLSKA